MRKTAIIDIDNTLWQFSDPFYLELKKINRNFPTPDRWTTPAIWEGYCSVEVFIAAINTIHHNQDSDQYQPYAVKKLLWSNREREISGGQARQFLQDLYLLPFLRFVNCMPKVIFLLNAQPKVRGSVKSA